jgi:hypothetical protein
MSGRQGFADASRAGVRSFVLAIVVTAYVLIRCGFGTFPALDLLMQISRGYPSIAVLEPMAQYLHYSPIGPLVGHVLGVQTATSFQVMHVAVFVVAMIAIAVVVARRYGSKVAWVVVVAFVTSQTAVVMAAWIGSYDVFTWLFGSAIVLTRRRGVAIAIGTLAALSAFEQTLISVVLLGAVEGWRRPRSTTVYLPALGGLVVGRVLLSIVLRRGGAAHDRFFYLRHSGISRFLHQFAHVLPVLVVTSLGGAVIVVVWCLGAIARAERTRWLFALAVALIPCALGEDQTRIYANITWPLILAITLRAGPLLRRRSRRAMTALALAAGLVIPPIYFWAGHVYLAEHHIWHTLG